MSLETQLQDLTAAVQDLARAFRESIHNVPQASPEESAQLPLFPMDDGVAPAPEKEAAPAEPEAVSDPEVDVPSPEDVMMLGRQLVASGLKTVLSNILIEVGGKQVKGLNDQQRNEFARLARQALEHKPDQADAA